MTKKETNKDKKQKREMPKTKRRKKRGTKKKINAKHKDENKKKRAKGINKASRRAANKKPLLARIFAALVLLPSRQRKATR